MTTLDEPELRTVQRLLIDAEQRAAEVPQLRLRTDELERCLADAHRETEAERARARELDEQLMNASQSLVDLLNSPSWRITSPLRRAKQLLR
jgi:hypothetical protein